MCEKLQAGERSCFLCIFKLLTHGQSDVATKQGVLNSRNIKKKTSKNTLNATQEIKIPP